MAYKTVSEVSDQCVSSDTLITSHSLIYVVGLCYRRKHLAP